ncbi:MAG: DUF4190 domain-containing protein [Planctomycetota bacterium]|jgi:hypothetical protein
MPGKGDGPRDPRKSGRPKDSEFYQIPPDLKKEFDLLMRERSGGGGAAVEAIGRALEKRKRLGMLSLVFGVLGGALLFIGPALAITFGVTARRTGKGIEGMPAAGTEPARFGILLGAIMIPVNILTLYFLFGR